MTKYCTYLKLMLLLFPVSLLFLKHGRKLEGWLENKFCGVVHGFYLFIFILKLNQDMLMGHYFKVTTQCNFTFNPPFPSLSIYSRIIIRFSSVLFGRCINKFL